MTTKRKPTQRQRTLARLEQLAGVFGWWCRMEGFTVGLASDVWWQRFTRALRRAIPKEGA